MLYCGVTNVRFSNFWQYFEPVREHMPQNCSSDVQAVIAHLDSTFTSGNQSEINDIKAKFGFENLTSVEDVAAACESQRLASGVYR